MVILWDNQGQFDRVRDATAMATWTSTQWEYATVSPGDVLNVWETQRATTASAVSRVSTVTP